MIINTQTAGRCGNHPPPLCCFWYLVEVIYAFRILLKCSENNAVLPELYIYIINSKVFKKKKCNESDIFKKGKDSVIYKERHTISYIQIS